jgi:hypothetical protein
VQANVEYRLTAVSSAPDGSTSIDLEATLDGNLASMNRRVAARGGQAVGRHGGVRLSLDAAGNLVRAEGLAAETPEFAAALGQNALNSATRRGMLLRSLRVGAGWVGALVLVYDAAHAASETPEGEGGAEAAGSIATAAGWIAASHLVCHAALSLTGASLLICEVGLPIVVAGARARCRSSTTGGTGRTHDGWSEHPARRPAW